MTDTTPTSALPRMAQLAASEHLLRPEELHKALAIQAQSGGRLGDILTQFGYLSAGQVAYMRQRLSFELGSQPQLTRKTQIVGRQVVEQRLASAGMVAAAQKEWALQRAEGRETSLTVVLAEMKVITGFQQVKLETLGTAVLYCKACRRTYRVEGYAPGYRICCLACRQPLGPTPNDVDPSEAEELFFDQYRADELNRFATLAFVRGFCTREQLTEAARLQAQERSDHALGALLVSLGHLSAEQLAALEDEIRRGEDELEQRRRQKLRRLAFGEIAQKLGFINVALLRQALSSQLATRKRGAEVMLGALMEDDRTLSRYQVMQVLALQGKRIASCPRCQARYNVPEGPAHTCPADHTPLEPPPPDAPLDVSRDLCPEPRTPGVPVSTAAIEEAAKARRGTGRTPGRAAPAPEGSAPATREARPAAAEPQPAAEPTPAPPPAREASPPAPPAAEGTSRAAVPDEARAEAPRRGGTGRVPSPGAGGVRASTPPRRPTPQAPFRSADPDAEAPDAERPGDPPARPDESWIRDPEQALDDGLLEFDEQVTVKFACVQCQKRLRQPIQQMDGRGRCPRCRAPVLRPEPLDAHLLEIVCRCGAPASGDAARCTACHAPIYRKRQYETIPTPSAALPTIDRATLGALIKDDAMAAMRIGDESSLLRVIDLSADTGPQDPAAPRESLAAQYEALIADDAEAPSRGPSEPAPAPPPARDPAARPGRRTGPTAIPDPAKPAADAPRAARVPEPAAKPALPQAPAPRAATRPAPQSTATPAPQAPGNRGTRPVERLTRATPPAAEPAPAPAAPSRRPVLKGVLGALVVLGLLVAGNLALFPALFVADREPQPVSFESLAAGDVVVVTGEVPWGAEHVVREPDRQAFALRTPDGRSWWVVDAAGRWSYDALETRVQPSGKEVPFYIEVEGRLTREGTIPAPASLGAGWTIELNKRGARRFQAPAAGSYLRRR